MTTDTKNYLETLCGSFAEQGYFFSIHHKIKLDNGDIAIPGKAYQKLHEAMDEAYYWSKRGNDVYMGMNAEHEAQETAVPYRHFKAIRKRYNIIMCSCIYLDMDVKEGAYATQKAALIALGNFVKQNNLPIPTIIVSSGTGGLHVYWVANELFTPDEFNLLSTALVKLAIDFGLLIDPQCSNDICRLLRVPDTFNYKVNPPLPVKLLYSGSKIPLATLKEQFKVNNVVYLHQNDPRVDDNDELNQPKREYPLADMNEVATYCPMFHSALVTNGESLSEPVWKMQLTAASYCKDGRELAHRLSSGHQAYVFEETENKYDQIELDKKNNPRLGPPHCSVFHKLGVEDCKTCNYYNLGTTPINLPNFHATPKSKQAHSRNADLPTGYYRSKDNTIWFDFLNKDTQLSEGEQVFQYPIIYNSAFAEGSDKGYQFVFTTIEGKNREKVVKLPMSSVTDKVSLGAALAKQGLPMIVTEKTRKFMSSFMSQLRSDDDTLILTNPIGWCVLPSGKMGFSYNGVCYYAGGTTKAQKLEGDLARHYSIQGSEQPWRDLCTMIVDQQRPGINALIAANFGAPLMALIGHFGCAFGAWSSRSGVGKSTALSLGQAIWGSTIRMSGLNDTLNQAIDIIATLRNIGCNWDEIKGNQQIQQFVQIIFELSRGREKGRLNRNSQQMAAREFEILLIWAANQPLFDETARQLKGTAAGNYRMLEYNVDETFITDLNVTLVTDLTGRLRHNHGHVGARYAKFLGENHTKLKDIVLKERDKFEEELKATQAERYYTSVITCIYLGARFANGLKITNFDIPKLREFLIDVVAQSRSSPEKTSSTDLSKPDDIEGMLSELMTAYAQQTIKTDTAARTTGRPQKGSVKVLNDNPNLGRQTVMIQVIKDTLTLRVSDPAIGKWCKDTGLTKSAFLAAVSKNYNAKATRSRIGSGTDYVTPPILVWEIPLLNTALGGEIEF